MKYGLMFPHQIRRAIEENWPVVMVLGVLEYHAHHLAAGTDTIPIVKAFERLEREKRRMVILPPFYYGAAIFECFDKTRGQRWWGNEEMKNYYAEHKKKTDPFSWIQFHPLSWQEKKQNPDDHAGRLETSLMMAVCPQGVEMKRVKDEHWYSRGAVKADKNYGRKFFNIILQNVRNCLGKGK